MKVLNDVLGYPLKIYQDQDYFCFSIDSVILANLVNIRLRTKKIVDLGTGNGIIPLLLSNRTNAHIDAVEIQKDLADMAIESIKYNKLESQINIYNQDMLDFSECSKYNTYDLVLSNPPYFKNEEKSTKNLDIHKVIARHEVKIKLENIVEIASNLLKERGVFATVNRVDRLMEIIMLLQKYNMEPKYIRFIYDKVTLKPNLFFLEAIKNGKSGLEVDKPFIMYDENNNETLDYQKLMGVVSNETK